ncbi:hypothetical protein [Bacillus infantis]|uniref:hypothetical protein n=1 Tax=Bacillus infantis TaxID=324767 RepID=UPI003CF2E4AB
MIKIETERECLIRDTYALNIEQEKPDQIIIGREARYQTSNLRVDLQTVDKNNLYREWEFKLYADYKALGQILVYVSEAKMESNFEKNIIGVIAAFKFQPELITTIRMMNLAIELVEIPQWMAMAGKKRLSNLNETLIDYKKYTLIGGN